MNNSSYRKQSKTVEHYTPNKYIESARLVMGSIDLDPASCDNANKYFVKANSYFTVEDDGLNKNWFGNVWLNPPYARGITGLWINKLINEYKIGNINQAIVLVNAVPERSWFLPLFEFTICFTDHRIKFFNEYLEEQTQPEYSNAICYLGENDYLFFNEFKQYGNIVQYYGKNLG